MVTRWWDTVVQTRPMSERTCMRRSLTTGALAAAAALLAPIAPAPANGTHPPIEYRGQAIVPTGTTFEGTEIGGLSSITYDAKRDAFYTISDDPRDTRYYGLRLHVADGALTNGDVEFTRVTRLQAPGGG